MKRARDEAGDDAGHVSAAAEPGPPAVKAEDGEDAPAASSKPSQLVLTNDATRDLVRKKLHEIFEAGRKEHASYLRDQDVNPAALARDCESTMLSHFDGSGKEYKARFRTLAFNLKDAKNPEFVRSVLMGTTFVGRLADMDVKEMASDTLKKERELWLERSKQSLMDEKTFMNYTGKKVQDGILKCPKCRSMKTEYTEVQTRSADEPTTKKCFCNDCTYRWKFC